MDGRRHRHCRPTTRQQHCTAAADSDSSGGVSEFLYAYMAQLPLSSPLLLRRTASAPPPRRVDRWPRRLRPSSPLPLFCPLIFNHPPSHLCLRLATEMMGRERARERGRRRRGQGGRTAPQKMLDKKKRSALSVAPGGEGGTGGRAGYGEAYG